MMGFKLKGRVVTAILLSLLLFTACSAFAEEKEKLKRFEVLFAGGIWYAAPRISFSPEVGFSYHIRDNITLSFEFSGASHFPELDFTEFGIPVGEGDKYTSIWVKNQYRLLSSLSGEYSFDIFPKVNLFITAGVGWSRDYIKFNVEKFDLEDYPDIQESRVEYEQEFHKVGFPLLLIGGGVRYSIRKNEFLKVLFQVLDPGGDFATYQIIAGWGLRF